MVLLFFPIAMVVLGLALLPGKQDTSFIEQATARLRGKSHSQDGGTPDRAQATQPSAKGIADSLDGNTSYDTYRRRGRTRQSGGEGGVKYRALQVIQRPGADPNLTLPIGTSFIGRLINGIDSREQNSFVRVLVPYGASFDHDRRIDRNSVIFGTASYPGSGEKVYVKFSRVLFPDGREYKIEAQALSSFDYSPGLSGDEHDTAGARIGTTVGLSMLSGMSDAMVERESLGQYAAPTPKANLKNGFLNGISKATEAEAQRRAAKINEIKDFVTIEAGADVIISLTETFKGESL